MIERNFKISEGTNTASEILVLIADEDGRTEVPIWMSIHLWDAKLRQPRIR